VSERGAIDLLSQAASAPDWQRALVALLRAGPEPERAISLAERVLEAAHPAPSGEEQTTALLRVLAATCSVAPFLASFLVRNPDWLSALAGEDYTTTLPLEQLDERLQATRRAAGSEPAATWLRRFKYYELARITVRDAWPDHLPPERSGETLAELSALADAILAEAERCAREELCDRIGPPVYRDGAGVEHELGFCVLGLGKLGSQELNYSSDVDLVYIYESTPDISRPSSSSRASGNASARSSASAAPMDSSTASTSTCGPKVRRGPSSSRAMPSPATTRAGPTPGRRRPS